MREAIASGCFMMIFCSEDDLALFTFLLGKHLSLLIKCCLFVVRLEKRQDGRLVEEDRTEDSVLSNPVLSTASPSHPGKNIWPFLDHFHRSKSRLMQIVHFLFFFLMKLR